MQNARPYLMRCSACGTKNRIPAAKVGEVAKCGKCHAAIETRSLLMAEPVFITDANFHTQVLKSPLPIVLDCWAQWCSACHTITPIMHEIAAQYKGRLRVGKLNTEQNPMTTSRFQILSLPTLLIFDGGQLRDTLAGAYPKPVIMQRLAPFI